MAYEAKTRVEPTSVAEFIAGLDDPRRGEAERLVALFSDVTGWQPRLYTGGMVGFGRYAYTYATGHSGTALATGFAPRKADLSLYIMPGYSDHADILARLGKHRTGKACLYLKRLSDADEGVLGDLIRAGLRDLGKLWPVEPT